MDETELQHRLTRLAERTAPPPREFLAEVVVARHRTQRRQVAGLTGLVAVVAAVVVAVPSLTGGSSAEPVSATATGGALAGDLFAGPTRGSLAEDAAFLEGVRQETWVRPGVTGFDGPEPALDTRRVLFAGDVGGSRLALVRGEVDDGVALAWFVGQAGAAPDDLELQTSPRDADSYAGPVALVVPDTGAVVVVGEPGDAISLSLRPEVAADGSVGRDFQPVDAPDGAATLVLPGDPGSGQALRYRVVRGTETWMSGFESTGSPGSTHDVPITLLRPGPPPSPSDALFEHEPDMLLDQLGLTAADVDVAVVWTGDMPSPTATPSRVTVFTMTLPSGAVFVQCSIGLLFSDGSAGGSWCGSEIRPAGPAVTEQTFVVRADATDMTANLEVVSSLVVIAPAGAASARALDLDGAVLAEFPLSDGIGIVPFPTRAASVETLSGDGTVLQQTRPMTLADLGD